MLARSGELLTFIGDEWAMKGTDSGVKLSQIERFKPRLNIESIFRRRAN